jgi:cytochrome P450
VLATIPLWLIVKAVLKKKRPKLPYPPGPKPILFLGNALQFPDAKKGANLDAKLLEWAMEYGLIYSIHLPVIGRQIVCADPELIKYITVTKNFPKSFTYDYVAPLIGERSILVLEKKEWAEKRRAFNPAFGPAFLKNMVSTMTEKLNQMIQHIEQDIHKDKPTNMLQRSQAFTSDVIVSIAFGEDWGGRDDHPARVYLDKIATLMAGIFTDPGVLLFGFSTKRSIRKYGKLLDQEMIKIVERHVAKGSSGDSKDICSIAIDQYKHADGSLTEDDKLSICHQLKTFYLAGHETTSIAISWSIWLLSRHDQILAKLRAELKQCDIWTNVKTPPTYEQLHQCSYLEAVIKESLRLYPPATVSRFTPDLDQAFKGYTIGGALLVISPYVTHRHPSLWKEPGVFRPERFLDGSEENLGDKYLPFLRGPRDCIGKYFAYLELKLAVSSLVMRYDLKCVDPNETIVTYVTNIPRNGAQVMFHARELDA